ncbi:MAG: ATP synthase F1 subunit epsilon [Bacteroidota bacterium]
MKLEIVTPQSRVFSGEVRMVQVPGSKGSFTILKNHAPIISTLEKGKVRIIDDSYTDREFPVNGGIVEVNRNIITILAE